MHFGFESEGPTGPGVKVGGPRLGFPGQKEEEKSDNSFLNLNLKVVGQINTAAFFKSGGPTGWVF